MNALVMYDRQTNTLWSQFLSLGVRGPLAGTRLEVVPVVLTTWEAWIAEYPDSKVLRRDFPSFGDTYDSYYDNQGMAGVLGRRVRDNRLPLKELVLGTGFDAGPKAFPHSVLEKRPVVNDSVGKEPVVVWFDPGTATALAYSRRVDDRTLSFQSAATADRGLPLLKDEETGTLWSPLSGAAIDGPMAGKKLERIRAMNAFWFAWADFYPESEIFAAS
jgi:hypothetical protein